MQVRISIRFFPCVMVSTYDVSWSLSGNSFFMRFAYYPGFFPFIPRRT